MCFTRVVTEKNGTFFKLNTLMIFVILVLIMRVINVIKIRKDALEGVVG